ncbi:MAG: hypothetical protein WCQ53_08105 [bacterium]
MMSKKLHVDNFSTLSKQERIEAIAALLLTGAMRLLEKEASVEVLPLNKKLEDTQNEETLAGQTEEKGQRELG